MKKTTILPSYKICFGMDRATDELSITSFIKRFADDKLLTELVPKLSDHEIQTLLDCLSGTMKKHLNEQQYHKLFLSDQTN
jgi:hypothetical protein